ncbi:MAG: hypothetical protein IH624_00945 [Phycisphaerae bacterium]|nr:hypothetical protein [Phycisphaerae bacterium]
MLLALIIYFAGFATAIYYLAPANDEVKASERSSRRLDIRGRTSEFRKQEWAATAETSLKTFVSFAEEKAVQFGEFIRAKLAEADKK